MMFPMQRTSFGFRKEITIFQFERGLLYREGKLERVLEPGRYEFKGTEPVEVAKISLREMSHVVPGGVADPTDRSASRLWRSIA